MGEKGTGLGMGKAKDGGVQWKADDAEKYTEG